MKKGIVTALLLPVLGLAGLSFNAQATERMYGLATVGYTDAEFGDTENKGVAYSLALGHQFSSKWYVEAGYQNLLDEEGDTDALKAQGLYLAVLGKAGGRTGELYYKLGVMNVDVQGLQSIETGSCQVSDIDSIPEGFCAYDDGIIAGMAGLGFDYHVGLNSMLRMEALYVRGQDDFAATVLNLGFRYNFN
ncbi:MAG: hypothetical protein CL587_16395 [Alteromonadaceae bacterium]|nr:hypothetical protein [Alteromonadaceae bacterium]